MGRTTIAMALTLAALGCGSGGGGGSDDAEVSSGPVSGEASDTFVQIPTDVGNVWCRIFFPEEAHGYRFGTVGPVVVYTGGNTTAWSLDGTIKTSVADFERLVREGFIVITWHLPGTFESIDGTTYASDGTFDYRGDDTIAALRDVLKFAMGSLTTADGRTLKEIAPGAQISNVGLVGFSNGGNLSWATLDRYGSELTGLDWYVGYETPIDNEIRAVGRVHSDPDPGSDGTDSGFTTDDGFNPHAGTCTEAGGWDFDTDKLVYNTTSGKNMKVKFDDGTEVIIPGVIFFDGNGNAWPDHVMGNFDVNGNGKFDTSEDFQIGGNPVEIDGVKKIVLPIRVREAMSGLHWRIATGTETIEYWAKREMAASIPVAAVQVPNLRTILFYSKLDHDLPAFPGNSHAHVYSAYALHADNGLWVRLNPGLSHVEDIFSREGVAIPVSYVENAANLSKSTALGQMHELAAPDATDHYWLYLAASACELADDLFSP